MTDASVAPPRPPAPFLQSRGYSGSWFTWTLHATVGHWIRSGLLGLAPLLPGGLGFVLIPPLAVLAVLAMGLLQWAALRRLGFPLRLWPWVAAMLAGHLAGSVAVLLVIVGPLLLGLFGPVARLVGGPAFMLGSRLLGGALLGAAVAGTQALVLRRLGPVTRWWIVAGATAGATAALPVLERVPGEAALGAGIKAVMSGLAYGSLTGLGLIALLRQRRAPVPE